MGAKPKRRDHGAIFARRLSDGTDRATAERLARRSDAVVRLREAYLKRAALQSEIEKLIRQAFPRGARVSWRHGDSLRTATVMDYSFARVKVCGVIGHPYWVSGWSLLDIV